MNNIEKPKAYSYVRMSTDIQLKGDSLRRQKESSKNYAEENNLELIETIQDLGISAFSGKNSKDGALGVFLNAVESNKIKAGSFLLVESLDRLSRESVLTAFNQFTSILRQNIVIVTLADNQVYTQESVNDNIGQLFTSLGIMLRANEESKTKSIRLKAAWLNKRNSLSTKKYTGISPAWLIYDKVLDEFKINDVIAKAVKKIYKMSLEGYGAYSICTFLNTHLDEYPSYKSKTGWHKSYIQKILNNKAVYGEFQAHKMENGKRVEVGDVIEDYFPMIISKDDYELSQTKLKQRTLNGAGRKGDTFSNIFTRLIRCKGCGAIVVFRNKGKAPKGSLYLKCGNSERKLICSAPAWEYEAFENSFFTFISELNLEEIFKNKDSLAKKDQLNNELDILIMKLDDANKEYKQLFDIIGKAPVSIIQDLINKAEAKKNEIESIKSKTLKIKNEFLDFEQNISSTVLKENIIVYKSLVENTTENELKVIRQKIHNEIKQIVSEIHFHNLDKYFAGDDLTEMTDKIFIEALKKRRYKSTQEQENYLLTDAGSRFFNEYERSYAVVFKNGVTKLIKPSTQLIMTFNNRRTKALLEKNNNLLAPS